MDCADTEQDEMNGWYCLNGEEVPYIECSMLGQEDCDQDSGGLTCIWDDACRIKDCGDLEECDVSLNGFYCFMNNSKEECMRWDERYECSEISDDKLCNSLDQCFWNNGICHTYLNVIDCSILNDEDSCLSQLFC